MRWWGPALAALVVGGVAGFVVASLWHRSVPASVVTALVAVGGAFLTALVTAIVALIAQGREHQAQLRARRWVLDDREREALVQLLDVGVAWVGAMGTLTLLGRAPSRDQEEFAARMEFMKVPPRVQTDSVREAAQQFVRAGLVAGQVLTKAANDTFVEAQNGMADAVGTELKRLEE